MVFLQEELGDARLRCAQLKKYIHDATQLVEKSDHRDHLFEVAGNLIYGVPDTLMKLDKALDATALAAARLDYEEIKNGLRPEKADELEMALEETRLRYLNRRSGSNHERFKFRCPAPVTHIYETAGRLKDRGIQAEAGTEIIYGTIEAVDADDAAAKLNQAAGFILARPSEIHKSARKESAPMNAKSAAYFLNKIADLTDKQGRVPMAAVMTLVAKLEKGDKRAATLSTKASSAFRNIAKTITTQEHPSRVQIASVLRRIVGDTLQVALPQLAQQEGQQGQGQGQQQQQALQQPLAGAGEDFQKANPKITDEEAKVIDEMHDKHEDQLKK